MNSRSVSALVALVLTIQLGWAGMAAAEDEAAVEALPGATASSTASSTAIDFEPSLQPILLAQDGGTVPRELEPRYESPPPGKPGPYNEQERQFYNSDYLFGITRALVNSTIVPAGKAPLFLFTVPLDIVFLPFAAIGGFFG